jgi:PAS domain S-box-containing protein
MDHARGCADRDMPSVEPAASHAACAPSYSGAPRASGLGRRQGHQGQALGAAAVKGGKSGGDFSETSYRLLVESIVDYAVYMIDPDGRVISWNPGAERIKGYTAADALGCNFSSFFTEEDRQAGKPARLLETARRQGRCEDEGWRVRKDGTRIWALAVLDPVRDAAGKLIGFAKITRDMTERRRAQEALKESERRFRQLVEGVTDYALFMLDPDGRISNWNVGAERIKGYAAGEVLGQHVSMFYTPEDRSAGLPEQAIRTARETGRYEAEGWRQRKDGTRFWASVVIDAVHDDTGKVTGYAKVTRDVTERREAQQRLEQTRAQLFQAQKMEALGQLTGGMAHDFNNLLTAVIGGANLAGRALHDRERAATILNQIREAAQRGAVLTRKLLAFARRQPLKPEVIDLAERLPQAATLAGHSLRGDIELVTETPANLWKVEVDPGELELALLNLAVNARDAMPEGGSLRITAANVSLNGEPEGLAGEFVAISVADTGTGIPQEIITRVFDPFFTTKQFGQGTGLGLSQVYGFAKQSNGTVTVQSKPGHGTTLVIYLPARMPDGSLFGGNGHRSGTGSGARILVVEDDPVVAQLAAEMLREMGHMAEVAHSAAEALSLLQRGPAISLMFADVVMPGGMSGFELAQRVRARYPEVPVLLTTGYSDTVAKKPSEFPLLAKPYEYDELSTAVAHALAHT